MLAVKDHESQIQEKETQAEIKHAKELQERLNSEEHDHGASLEATEKRLERLLAAQKQTETKVLLGRQKVETLEQEIEAETARLKRREKEVHEIAYRKRTDSPIASLFHRTARDHRIDDHSSRRVSELEGSLPEASKQ